MWTESEESTKKAAAEATDLSPEAGVPGGAAASPGTMVGGTAAASALHDIRIASPVPGGGVAPGGGAATGEHGGGVGGGNVGGRLLVGPLCTGHQEECELRIIAHEVCIFFLLFFSGYNGLLSLRLSVPRLAF